MGRAFWLDRGWYIAMWLGISAMFVVSAWWFSGRVIRSQERQGDRIVNAIERNRP